MVPDSSLRIAVETLIGAVIPDFLTIRIILLTHGFPLLIVFFNKQSRSHTSAWNTSQHLLPIAISRGTPVIFSAALLKDVIFQSLSTVKTPSAMESRIGSNLEFWSRLYISINFF